MQHTPGPWKARPLGDPFNGRFQINNEEGEHRIYVALVYDYHQPEANANLIAAAPELLQALENLVQLVDVIAKYPANNERLQGYINSETRLDAVNAINKAKGGN